jgi:hypothetical protein
VRYLSRVWFYQNEKFPAPEYKMVGGILVGKTGSASAFVVDCLDAAGILYPKESIDQFHLNVHAGIQRALQAEIDYPSIEDQLDRKSRGPFKTDPW